MMLSKFAVASTLICLTACSKGDGRFTMRSFDDYSINIPPVSDSELQFALVDNVESVLVNEGDRAQIESEVVIAGVQGYVVVTRGETNRNGLTVYRADMDSPQNRFLIVTNDLQGALTVDPTTTETSISTTTVDGITLRIDRGVDGAGFQRLGASSTDTASFVTQTVVAGAVQDAEAISRASGSTFTSPSGNFSYSGIGALQWLDSNSVLQTASGTVTMVVDFTAGTGSVDGRNLQGLAGPAAFYGDIAVDTTSGHFASSESGTVERGGRSGAAGILGSFSADASEASGAVFDAVSGGATSGVFTLVQQ
jgi:hypothetical protein